MTAKELHDKFGWHETFEEIKARFEAGQKLHPTYEKHLPACWIIQDVYGAVENGKISLGKARELTASIIEENLKGNL